MSGRPIKRRIRNDNAAPVKKKQKTTKDEQEAENTVTEPTPIVSTFSVARSIVQPFGSPQRYGTNRPLRAALPNLTRKSRGMNRLMRATLPVPRLMKKSRGMNRLIRTTLPVRVLNLTKNSRGMRAPVPKLTKKSRSTRGEHSKRHISTHKKPPKFKCTYPNCEKYFNRVGLL